MRSTSTRSRANSSLPDRERRSGARGRAKRENNGPAPDSAVRSPCPDDKAGAETTEFVALCQALTSVNHRLLSSIDEVVASIGAPEAQPLLEAIANQAESIRNRMSLIAKLAADLKDAAK